MKDNQGKEMVNWPEIPEKEPLRESVLAEIARNLPLYTFDIANVTLRNNDRVQRLYDNFYVYCWFVKEDYFEAKVKNLKGAVQAEARKLAGEAFELIDSLLECVITRIERTPFDKPLPLDNIPARWDTVVRKWNLLQVECEGQQGEIPRPQQVEKIPVNEDRLEAYAEKDWHSITDSQLRIIKKLNENPGAWVAGKNLKANPISEERPDKIIKPLPKPLRKRIESSRNGYRLS